MNPTQILNDQIEVSVLATEEKAQLKEILFVLSDEEKATLSTTIVDNPALIPYLWVNYSAKRYALSKGDKEAIRVILDSQASVAEGIV